MKVTIDGAEKIPGLMVRVTEAGDVVVAIARETGLRDFEDMSDARRPSSATTPVSQTLREQR